MNKLTLKKIKIKKGMFSTTTGIFPDSLDKILCGGWEGGLVFGKALVQAWDPEFASSEPT